MGQESGGRVSTGQATFWEGSGADEGYRGPQVCKIVGITYRQLDYWARTDLIRPSVADARAAEPSAATRIGTSWS